MPITMQEAVQRTIEHREIFHDEMLALMRKIMSGEASPVMIAALTIGLRVKKETVGEITMCVGSHATISESVIASLRCTCTSAPSSPRYWTRFQVKLS